MGSHGDQIRPDLLLRFEDRGYGIVLHHHHSMGYRFRKVFAGELAGMLRGRPETPPELRSQRLRLSYGEISRRFQALCVKDGHLRPKGLGDQSRRPQSRSRVFAEVDGAENMFGRKVIHRIPPSI
jgi:hypothetical protein